MGRLLFALLLWWPLAGLLPGAGQAAVTAEHLMRLASDLDQPTDVAVREDGRAYVLDGANGRVVVFTRDGERDFVFARPGRAAGELALPMGIATDDERLFIADTGNHRIAVFSLRGEFLRNIPLRGEAPPEPVAVTVSEGRLWWTDRRNHRLCGHDLRNDRPLFCRGSRGDGREQFRFPLQIASDAAGYLHVVDVLNGRLQVLHPRGRFAYDMGRFGPGSGELFRPNGLAFAAQGLLLVGDAYLGQLSLFRDGSFAGLLAGADGRPLRFRTPVGLRVRHGRLYVADAGRNAVEVFRLRLDDAETELPPPLPGEARGSRRNCIGCHLSWAGSAIPPAAKGPGDVPGDEKVPPVISPRMCYSCHHGAVVDSRRRIGRGAQHPDIHHPRKKKTQATGDAQARKDEVPDAFPRVHGKALSCGSCHTPHAAGDASQETLYAGHANPWLRVPNRDGGLCRQCHASKVSARRGARRGPKQAPPGVNHPLGIRLAAPPTAAERRAYARDEHLHKGLPAKLAGQGATLGRQKQMLCQTCHQIHGGEGDAMTVLPVRDASLCIECHPRQHASDKKAARRKGIHPVDFKPDEPLKVAGETFERVTCFTCHSVHGGKPGTPLLREDHRDGKLCGNCHEDQVAVVGSDHDLRRTAKQSHNLAGQSPAESGVCGACHRLHGGREGEPVLHAWERHAYAGREKPLPRDRLCLDCHREKGLADESRVARFSHPSRDLVLRSDPRQMPLIGRDGGPGEFGAIGCVTCHDPHRWSPSAKASGRTQAPGPDDLTGNVLNSFLRRRGAKGSFCVDCHGLETPLKYKYFHDAAARAGGVDYLH